MREIVGRHALLARGAGHFWNAGFNEVRALEKDQDVIRVIIFTHNLLFFNEVVDAAAQASPAVPLVRNYINKSEAAGFGLISETDEPWIAQSVTRRVETLRGRLNSFDTVKDFTTDAWRRSAKDFYTDLRETWERLVEEILLGKVVEGVNVR